MPTTLPTPTRALVRRLAETYANLHSRPRHPVSLALAREQHDAYAQALQRAGLEVAYVEADDACPDCVFIEDTAVVWSARALLTRMAPHREGEQAAVESALKPTHAITRPEVAASLEGGDVLHAENATYVGLSSRTNPAGVQALERFLAPFGRRVVPVQVENCLHLKSAASYLGYGVMVVAPQLLDSRGFGRAEVIETAPGEEYAANCLRIGSYLLVPAGFPRTEEKLRRFAEKRSLEVAGLDCSEFQKGGGSLTCLSLLW